MFLNVNAINVLFIIDDTFLDMISCEPVTYLCIPESICSTALPCRNDGCCIPENSRLGSYRCQCPAAYTGHDCEVPVSRGISIQKK